MSRRERERAQRISDYADGLVVHRREERVPPFKLDDREFHGLTELARGLSAIEFKVSEEFRAQLREQLPVLTDTDAPPDRRWAGGVRSASRRAIAWLSRPIDRLSPMFRDLRTAAAMAPLVALVGALGWQVTSTRTASAAEILSRADTALSKLVHEGQVLHRRWKVTERVRGVDGGGQTVRESISTEWMDGSDFSRVAGRNERDGRVYLAYASAREHGEVRPRVYFAPGFSNEPRGLLSLEPSRREFQTALASFGPDEAAKLETYLDRGYIFEPISGERRFNRIALNASTESHGPLPRVMVSLREETLPQGTAVYAVRIVDPARVRFRWKSEGAPVAWLERRETVRYIARDTYLSLKAEETYDTEDGRRVHQVRELVETRIVESGSGGIDPFVLTVPDGTPVRRQSAREQLSAVAAVLGQIPAKLTR